MSATEAGAPRRDLVVVDLDGTLIATDTLWESLFRLLRKRPGAVFQVPAWLAAGKARFKERIAEEVVPDPTHLPYRSEVVRRLQLRKEAGSEIVLATASHERVAQPIASHLALFDRVLASNSTTNLSGKAKLAAIEEIAEGRPFDYVGNASADVPIWARSRTAIAVAPSRGAARGLRRLGKAAETWVPRAKLRGPALSAIRPHQWAKNTLVFAPLALAHDFSDAASLARVFVAFLTFCAVASATYLLNDVLDIESDRSHPEKRRRPIASGELSIPRATQLAGLLVIGGFALSAIALSPASTAMLAIYFALTSAYSLWLKERLFLDVMLLAGLYTQRVLAGGVAAPVDVSTWLLAFSLFFFLGLALIKRYVELIQLDPQANASLAGRAYRPSDRSLIEVMGIASGYVSVLVLGLYVSSEAVSQLYARPELLWLVSPIMLFWISRMWFLALRGRLPSDPVLFATTDRTSYFCGALIFVVGGIASGAGP